MLRYSAKGIFVSLFSFLILLILTLKFNTTLSLIAYAQDGQDDVGISGDTFSGGEPGSTGAITGGGEIDSNTGLSSDPLAGDPSAPSSVQAYAEANNFTPNGIGGWDIGPNLGMAATGEVYTSEPVGQVTPVSYDPPPGVPEGSAWFDSNVGGWAISDTSGTTGAGTGGSDPITAGVDAGADGGGDPGADGGGDDGYVPPPASGPPVQTLTSVVAAGCDGIYPLVRYDFTASWSPSTVKFEVWRQRRDLDNFTVVREVSAPGSYLDDRLDSNSYTATYVEYFIRRVDSGYGNLDTNTVAINVQNCNPITAPLPPAATPPPPGGGAPGDGGTPPTGGEVVTLNSAVNTSCAGIYPRVAVNFSSNFSPPGGYQLWHINNPYRGWEVFATANAPGTYIDDRADSNWYQGVTTYMVRAIDGSGGRLVDSNNIAIVTSNCNPSTSAQFIPPSPKAYCSGNEGRVTLSWTIPQNFSVNNGDRYYIQRVDGADNRIEYGPTEANSFEDSNIASGQIYSYNIRAVTSVGTTDSGWSNAVSGLNCNAPLTNLYINGSRAPLPILSGTQTQITWDSQNATECVGSSNPTQSGWDGVKSASGSRSTGALKRPPERVSYTLSCTNANNGQVDSKTVSVDIRAPSSCIKTTGGDVHSNAEISAPEDCP